MLQRRFSHLRFGLHCHLLGADFFDLSLRGKASGSQLKLALGLDSGQSQFVLLVGFVLEVFQQLRKAGDQQASES
jgi:hypothetical protein